MKPSDDKPMTARLPAELASQLEKLAAATGRDKSAITVAALRAYIEAEALQIQDVQDGIAEADRGEFASIEDANSFFAKYGG